MCNADHELPEVSAELPRRRCEALGQAPDKNKTKHANLLREEGGGLVSEEFRESSRGENEVETKARVTRLTSSLLFAFVLREQTGSN